jgi:hypothetical protein
MLTPYADTTDAESVLRYKDEQASHGFAVGPSVVTDPVQLVALRSDAIALLKAYAGFLRTRIIPHYKPLFELGPSGMADVRVRSKEELRKAIAEEERLEALSIKNGYKNREQRLLQEFLEKICDAAAADGTPGSTRAR